MGQLMKFRIPGIQRYIFQTPNLREIRGASALVEDLSGSEMRTQIADLGGDIWYLAAGHGAIYTESSADAEALQAAIREQVETSTGMLSPQFATTEFQSSSSAVRALAKLDRILEQMPPPASSVQALHSVFKNCQSCKRFPASEILINSEERVCQACKHKRDRLHRGKDLPYYAQFADFLNQKPQETKNWRDLIQTHPAGNLPWHEAVLAQDLNQLTETAARPGYLCLIYADANNLGRFVKQRYEAAIHLRGSLKSQVRVLDHLSRTIESTMQTATFEALIKTWPHPPKAEQTLPFELLYLGGDDLLFVCVADKGMAFAQNLLQAFQTATQKAEMKLSMSIGAVFAKAHTPMAALIQHAKQVLDKAKQHAFLLEKMSHATSNAVDFSVLTETSMRQLDDQRHRAYRSQDGAWLCARPFNQQALDATMTSLNDLGKSNIRPIRLLPVLEACRRSKLQGTVAMQALLARMSKGDRKAILEILKSAGHALLNQDFHADSIKDDMPWLSPNQTPFTPLGDWLALAPFLEAEGGRP